MKFRKIITLFSLFFSVGILSGCNSANDNPSGGGSEEPAHVHSYVVKSTAEKYLASAADCTHPAKYYYSCSCGEAWTETFESGEALGHKWHQEVAPKYLASEASCKSRALYHLSCERCGEASSETFGVGEPSAHKFTKVVISPETLKSEATCTAPAYYYYSCEDCGEIDHEHSVSVGDPLGHVWEEVADSTHLVKEATCLDKAVYHVSCSRCHENHPSMTFEYGDPLGHEFTHYEDNHDATCTHNGTETAHCNHAGCEATDTREIEDSMLEHSLVEEVLPQYLNTAATCLEDATYRKHCENCEYISDETFADPDSKLGHDISPITGHCTHAGCEETVAMQIEANYGDGAFNYVDANDEDMLLDLPKDNKVIYDFKFTGSKESTNFYFIPRRSGGQVYSSNVSISAFDEDGNTVDYRRVQGSRLAFIFDRSFNKDSHLYVHVTVRLTDFEDFFLGFATHQYTNLNYVPRKIATCVSPLMHSHFTFDESETVGMWINDVATEIKAISTYFDGEEGTGHELTHYVATTATAEHPGLKEHWFCEKCGGYFLDPNVDEECKYEDLYSDLLYGKVRDTVTIAGRGTMIKVLITHDAGETPIETNDPRYISGSHYLIAHVIRDNNTIVEFAVTQIIVNNHMGEFMLRGVESETFETYAPVAVWFHLA